MMDVQSLMDGLSGAMRGTREDYHLTLEGVIKTLTGATGFVRFADGSSPGQDASYRGYYSDLAFDSQRDPKTAQQFLEQCQNALDATYEGYKGGDFVMDGRTPLWRAVYGDTGDAITDCVPEGDGWLLITRKMR